MRELSLFTGAGGGLLGSMLLGWRTVAAVEYDPYCQRLLCRRGGFMADADGREPNEPESEDGEADERSAAGRSEFWPRGRRGFPVYGDVRAFDGTAWQGRCDIVTGGFPCQPHSQAGKRLGGLDDRDLWPDTVRILRESGAPLGFFENVPGLLTSRDADGLPMFGRILGDLSAAGFDAEWCVLGADDVGAPHRRKRLWILAVRHGYDARMHARAVGGATGAAGRDTALDLLAGRGQVPSGGPWWVDPADVPDTECGRCGREVCAVRELGSAVQGRGASRDAVVQACERVDAVDEWLAQPYVGRVAHGVASRVDRLRALGNGQVPQCMAAAFVYLAGEAGLLGGE